MRHGYAWKIQEVRLAGRDVPGSRAKTNVPVEVSVTLAPNGTGTRVRYSMDGAESDWLELAGGGTVHGVGVRGTLHSLRGEYENLAFSGLLIRFARK